MFLLQRSLNRSIEMSAKSDTPDIEKLVGQLNANYATWIATQLKTNPTADCKKLIAPPVWIDLIVTILII